MVNDDVFDVKKAQEYLKLAQEELNALNNILTRYDDEDPALAFMEAATELQRLIGQATVAALRPVLEDRDRPGA